MNRRSSKLVLVPFLFLCHAVFAQSRGYYISRTVTYPDAAVTTETTVLPISSNREDVKAIGMGRTQVGNGTHFNAMLYNPALLANGENRYELPGVQASLPTKSYSAISFLKDHVNEFRTGNFIKHIKGGLRDLQTAATEEQALAALRRIQLGLQFPAELQDKVGGTLEDPRTHGITLVPGVAMQVGNLGVSVYGIAQSGFQVQSGEAVSSLSKVRIPDRVQDLTPEEYAALVNAISSLLDENGNLREDAMPAAFAVSYVDLVGVVGYALPLSAEFSIGANLKIVNRRFSSKRIGYDFFESIVSELRKDFATSATGVTADVGALYRTSGGTQVGLSVQNVIPMKSITSNMTMNYWQSGIVEYDRDQNGNHILNQYGDTAVVAAQRKLKITMPFELKEPLLVNLGVKHPLTDEWDVALDLADVAAQNDLFEDYLHRVRIGTEYRFDAVKDKFGVAVRAGLAGKRPTFGLGVNLFRFIQLDGAYAHDTFTDENAFFAQVKVGW